MKILENVEFFTTEPAKRHEDYLLQKGTKNFQATEGTEDTENSFFLDTVFV